VPDACTDARDRVHHVLSAYALPMKHPRF
jgi:hypothetical protein